MTQRHDRTSRGSLTQLHGVVAQVLLQNPIVANELIVEHSIVLVPKRTGRECCVKETQCGFFAKSRVRVGDGWVVDRGNRCRAAEDRTTEVSHHFGML